MEPVAKVPDIHNMSYAERRKLKGKNHACESCGEKFKEARIARLHYEREHLKVTHSCVTCNKVYKDLTTLKSHQLKFKQSGSPCNNPARRIFCKICCTSHLATVEKHEKCLTHQKHVKEMDVKSTELREKLGQNTASNQRFFDKNNLQVLSTTTGDADIEDSDSDDAWAADGDSSD